MQIKLIEITNNTKRDITYAIHTYAYAYITNNLNRTFFFLLLLMRALVKEEAAEAIESIEKIPTPKKKQI